MHNKIFQPFFTNQRDKEQAWGWVWVMIL